jgi:hypothetical protein
VARLELDTLDEETNQRLLQEANRQGLSVEALAARLLKESLRAMQVSAHHDLDALAGTWSEADAKEFLEAILPFEEIDEAMWQ